MKKLRRYLEMIDKTRLEEYKKPKKKPVFTPGKESKGGQNPSNTSDKRPLPPMGSDGKDAKELLQ